MHRQMKIRIIPFHRMKETVNNDFRIQLLPNLTHKSLLRTLPSLHLAAREFPPVLPGPVSAFRRKNTVSVPDNSSYNLYPLHIK